VEIYRNRSRGYNTHVIITLFGRIPSKKNSKQVVCRGRYPMVFPSERFVEWHRDATQQLMSMGMAVSKMGPMGHVSVTITIYAPDARVADLTNKAESIMDLLVDNGILADDNWFVCPDVHLIFGGVDKISPRAVIEILNHGK
jgi:Holliday junction resolvase RusA-like endonuclease